MPLCRLYMERSPMHVISSIDGRCKYRCKDNCSMGCDSLYLFRDIHMPSDHIK